MRRITPPAAGSQTHVTTHSVHAYSTSSVLSGLLSKNTLPSCSDTKPLVHSTMPLPPRLLPKRIASVAAEQSCYSLVHDDDRSKSEAPHEGQLPADSSELRHAPAIGASEYPELAQPKVHRQNRAELDEHEKGPVFRVECGECDETPPLPEDIDVEEVVTESNGASTTARTEVALLKARHVAFHVLKLNSGWVFMQNCVRRLHSRRWQLCVAAMLSAPVLLAMLVISPLWAVWIWSTDDV